MGTLVCLINERMYRALWWIDSVHDASNDLSRFTDLDWSPNCKACPPDTHSGRVGGLDRRTKQLLTLYTCSAYTLVVDNDQFHFESRHLLFACEVGSPCLAEVEVERFTEDQAACSRVHCMHKTCVVA